MGRGSQNLLYQPIDKVLPQSKKSSNQWQAEIAHLDSNDLNRFEWLNEIINLADKCDSDSNLLSPLTNLLVKHLSRYINYGYLSHIEKDLDSEAKRLFTLLYNNHHLVEDKQKLESLFSRLIFNSLYYTSNRSNKMLIFKNLRRIYPKLIMPEGRLYIKPSNARGTAYHFLTKYSETRLCDGKSYSSRNWDLLNEANQDQQPLKSEFCQKCLKKANSPTGDQIAYRRQSFSIFSVETFKNTVECALARDTRIDTNKVNNYLEFQDQLSKHLLINKINQAAEQQLGWNVNQQYALRSELDTLNKQELTDKQLSFIPEVNISDL
jgi:hypothetical protein